MRSPLAIVLVAVVLVALSTLAVMNKACKHGEHAWCARMSTIRHHTTSRLGEADPQLAPPIR
jgi:hypothetical protein